MSLESPKNTTAARQPLPVGSDITHQQSAMEIRTPESLKTELRVEKVPELKVSTGTDFVAFGGFFVTAIIVLATTYLSVKTSRNMVFSQEKIANAKDKLDIEKLRAEKRADNRQEWINTLRTDLASYIGAVMNTWNLHQMSAGRQPLQRELDSAQQREESSKWSYEYNMSLREVERLKAKIKLLLNPTEEPSIALALLIDNAASIASSGKAVIAICDDIIKASQPILKDEWEKVKGLL